MDHPFVRLGLVSCTGKVLLCWTLARRNTYITLQLASFSSPPCSCVNAGHHLNINSCWYFHLFFLFLLFFSHSFPLDLMVCLCVFLLYVPVSSLFSFFLGHRLSFQHYTLYFVCGHVSIYMEFYLNMSLKVYISFACFLNCLFFITAVIMNFSCY